MSGSEAFFDSNVLLYLISADHAKAELAKDLMARRGVISVQVLNEFAAVASRKFRVPWPAIREVLSTVRDVCRVEPVTVETHDRGLLLVERYGFGFYDCIILAAAMRAGCSILYTEDLQDGQIIGQVTIRNPFASL